MKKASIFFERLGQGLVLLWLAARISHNRWRGDDHVVHFDWRELKNEKVRWDLVLFNDLRLVMLQ